MRRSCASFRPIAVCSLLGAHVGGYACSIASAAPSLFDESCTLPVVVSDLARVRASAVPGDHVSRCHSLKLSVRFVFDRPTCTTIFQRETSFSRKHLHPKIKPSCLLTLASRGRSTYVFCPISKSLTQCRPVHCLFRRVRVLTAFRGAGPLQKPYFRRARR